MQGNGGGEERREWIKSSILREKKEREWERENESE